MLNIVCYISSRNEIAVDVFGRTDPNDRICTPV